MNKSRPFWQPLITAGVLATGSAGVGIFAFLTSATPGVSVSGTNWIYPAFQFDGTPLIVSAKGYRDLSGNAVAEPKKGGLMYTNLGGVGYRRASMTTGTWNQRVRGFLDANWPPGYWYFVWDGLAPGSAYFVGYHSDSHECLGFIGTKGSRQDVPPLGDRFPFNGLDSGILTRVFGYSNFPYGIASRVVQPGTIPEWIVFVQADDEKVYQVDLQERTVRVFFPGEGPAPASIVAMASFRNSGSDGSKLFVRTNDAVLAVDTSGNVARRFPLPQELRGREIYWSELNADDSSWAYTVDSGPMANEFRHFQVYWINGTGGVTRRATFDLPGQTSANLNLLAGVFVPAPACLLGFAYVYGAGGIDYFWPSFVIGGAVAGWLAFCCYRRERRYADGRMGQLVWPIFVLALGLFGWIGYRFSRTWPALETCPACQALVPRDRAPCASCGADFPPPPMHGTEFLVGRAYANSC
jgi:hypothetical protein